MLPRRFFFCLSSPIPSSHQVPLLLEPQGQQVQERAVGRAGWSRGQRVLGNCEAHGESQGPSFCLLTLTCGHGRQHSLPSLALCGLSLSDLSSLGFIPSHPLQIPAKWSLHVKIARLYFISFLSWLSTIFIKWSRQSRAEKRGNHTALLAGLSRNSNRVGYF